jgi:hypothetical protein
LLLFPYTHVCINLDKKWIWLQLGRDRKWQKEARLNKHLSNLGERAWINLNFKICKTEMQTISVCTYGQIQGVKLVVFEQFMINM